VCGVGDVREKIISFLDVLPPLLLWIQAMICPSRFKGPAIVSVDDDGSSHDLYVLFTSI
jgi:hypothetical protein